MKPATNEPFFLAMLKIENSVSSKKGNSQPSSSFSFLYVFAVSTNDSPVRVPAELIWAMRRSPCCRAVASLSNADTLPSPRKEKRSLRREKRRGREDDKRKRTREEQRREEKLQRKRKRVGKGRRKSKRKRMGE